VVVDCEDVFCELDDLNARRLDTRQQSTSCMILIGAALVNLDVISHDGRTCQSRTELHPTAVDAIGRLQRMTPITGRVLGSRPQHAERDNDNTQRDRSRRRKL